MFDEPAKLTRELIRYIRKSVSGWDESDIKVLVKMLIESHEAIRRELIEEREMKEYYERKSRRRRMPK